MASAALRERGATENAVIRPANFLRSHTLACQCHPPEFARWTTPEFAIVSGGPQDNPAAMAGAYDAVGAQIVHTARSGAVTVSVNDGRLDVRTWQAGVE